MTRMNNSNANLESLLRELKFRTRVCEIPETDQSILVELLNREFLSRKTHRIQQLLSLSGIQKAQVRTFEDFNWSFNTKIPKQDILAFKGNSWVNSASNLVLIGNPGIGKTHLAKALCHDAILQGYPTCFMTAFDLVSKIKKARFPDTKISFYSKNFKVLCIDELGYVYHDKDDSDLLYHVISKRCEVYPTIVTTNLAPKDWGKILSGTAATAILDRLSFQGTFLTWEGDSYRMKSRRK
jgi:DNA replication protein DnaC